MLSIIYQKETLNDSILIACSNEPFFELVNGEDYTIGYGENNKIIFINVFKVSKHLQLPNGYLKLTSEISKFVKDITKIDLNQYDEQKPLVVGKVTECEDIKNTHLHKCKVDVGIKVLNIVCGANNVRKDLKVVVALVNSTIPNGTSINPNKLMGIESFGMICSAKELCLQNTKFNQEGIIELSDKYTIGQPFLEVYMN